MFTRDAILSAIGPISAYVVSIVDTDICSYSAEYAPLHS